MLPIVVCSRKADYLAQTARLVLHYAVVVRPLIEQQIDEYISRAAKHLTGVRSALHHDPTLQELAATPLMLGILAQAHRRTSSQNILLTNSLDERRRQIFASYVQQMLERRGNLTRYTSEQTMHWLSWLAEQLRQHGQTEFHLERMQANWLPVSRWRQFYYALTTKVIFGLLTGLIIALTTATLFGPFSVVFNGLDAISLLPSLGGLLGCGLLGGVLFGVMSKQKQTESAPYATRAWTRLRQGLTTFLIFGLVTGFLEPTSQSATTPTLRLGAALIRGLVGGFIGSLVVGSGLIKGLDGEIQPAEVMMWSWAKMRQSFLPKLRKGLFISLSIGLFFGLLFGVVVGVIVAQTPATKAMDLGSKMLVVLICVLGGGLVGLAIGLIPAMAIGLISGLAEGLSSDTLPESDLVRPNQGLWSSARHSALIGLVSGIATILIYGLTTTLLVRLSIWLVPSVVHLHGQVRDPFALLVNTMALGLLPALVVGLVFGLRNGGEACIQHGVLRLLLWRTNCLPWNYPRFLDYAAERILLRKVGGGYIFTHRLLLEYFASLLVLPYMPHKSTPEVDEESADNTTACSRNPARTT